MLFRSKFPNAINKSLKIQSEQKVYPYMPQFYKLLHKKMLEKCLINIRKENTRLWLLGNKCSSQMDCMFILFDPLILYKAYTNPVAKSNSVCESTGQESQGVQVGHPGV